MSVIEEVRDNLVDNRARLVTERDRLNLVIAGIDMALANMGRTVVQTEPLSSTKGPIRTTDTKAEIRRRIGMALKGAYPTGLTSVDLAEMIQQDLPGTEITASKIGANATQMVKAGEIVTDGAAWYWVPVDGDGGPAPEGS